ncbi:MAG: hypothetical protein RB191_04975 [Terriglobia bacterium]|nr:hypothetical protein [Terriglobia bacterium]
MIEQPLDRGVDLGQIQAFCAKNSRHLRAVSACVARGNLIDRGTSEDDVGVRLAGIVGGGLGATPSSAQDETELPRIACFIRCVINAGLNPLVACVIADLIVDGANELVRLVDAA